MKDLVLTPAEIAGSGDTAYEMGTVAASASAQDGGQTVAGKYMVVWRKGADGT